MHSAHTTSLNHETDRDAFRCILFLLPTIQGHLPEEIRAYITHTAPTGTAVGEGPHPGVIEGHTALATVLASATSVLSYKREGTNLGSGRGLLAAMVFVSLEVDVGSFWAACISL